MEDIIKVTNNLIKECLDDDEIIDSDKTIRYVLEHCEKNGRLTEHDGLFFSFVKTKLDNDPCVRMIIAFKQGKKKVCNIEKEMDILRKLEYSLIYFDQCKAKEEDSFFYLDIYKKITNKLKEIINDE